MRISRNSSKPSTRNLKCSTPKRGSLSSKSLRMWRNQNEADSFISSVTIAEMRYGVELADATHQPLLSQRVARTEVDFAVAIEPVDTDCLLEWKRVSTFLKSIHRTLPCEDISASAPVSAPDARAMGEAGGWHPHGPSPAGRGRVVCCRPDANTPRRAQSRWCGAARGRWKGS